MQRPRPSTFSDWTGIAISVACAVHCALGGLFVVAMTAAGSTASMWLPRGGWVASLGWLTDERLEWGLFGAALAVAFVSLAFSFRKHRTSAPLAMFGAAFATVSLARADLFGPLAEVALSVLGAVGLVSAHGLNLAASRAHPDAHAGHAHA